jgi:hypothetical protein
MKTGYAGEKNISLSAPFSMAGVLCMHGKYLISIDLLFYPSAAIKVEKQLWVFGLTANNH